MELTNNLIPDAVWEDAKDLEPSAFLDIIVRPLHDAVYAAQDFGVVDDMLPMQRLLIALDYVRQQLQQGGFIQLLQNGYGPLLAVLTEQLAQSGLTAAAKPLDSALQVFVHNHDALSRQTSVAEFAQLYQEFREFEPLEEEWNQQVEETLAVLRKKILASPELIGYTARMR